MLGGADQGRGDVVGLQRLVRVRREDRAPAARAAGAGARPGAVPQGVARCAHGAVRARGRARPGRGGPVLAPGVGADRRRVALGPGQGPPPPGAGRAVDRFCALGRGRTECLAALRPPRAPATGGSLPCDRRHPAHHHPLARRRPAPDDRQCGLAGTWRRPRHAALAHRRCPLHRTRPGSPSATARLMLPDENGSVSTPRTAAATGAVPPTVAAATGCSGAVAAEAGRRGIDGCSPGRRGLLERLRGGCFLPDPPSRRRIRCAPGNRTERRPVPGRGRQRPEPGREAEQRREGEQHQAETASSPGSGSRRRPHRAASVARLYGGGATRRQGWRRVWGRWCG